MKILKKPLPPSAQVFFMLTGRSPYWCMSRQWFPKKVYVKYLEYINAQFAELLDGRVEEISTTYNADFLIGLN